MPRIKTSRAAAKRFKLTGGGKIRRSRAYANHILTKKSSKRKRMLRKKTLVHATEAQRVRRLLAT